MGECNANVTPPQPRVYGSDRANRLACPFHTFRSFRKSLTILIDERADGVHLSYDRMASLLAPYESRDALQGCQGSGPESRESLEPSCRLKRGQSIVTCERRSERKRDSNNPSKKPYRLFLEQTIVQTMSSNRSESAAVQQTVVGRTATLALAAAPKRTELKPTQVTSEPFRCKVRDSSN